MSMESNNTSAKPYLDYLNDLKFSGTKVRVFVLSLENTTDRTVHTKCYLPIAKIKEYNVMIDGQKFSYEPVKNNLRAYDNFRRIATGQGDDYTK